MVLKDIVNLLANRINQPHVIDTYLRKVYNVGLENGYKKYTDKYNRWIPILEDKPRYYDLCLVKFENGEILLVWRSWSESIGTDIYTICGTNIIADSNPVEWKPINLK